MSIKTLRKRIALVAVSALGAGFMSVVAVPSANAGAFTSGAYLYVGSDSTTGAVVTTADDTLKSTGLLIQSDTGASIGGASQLTQTATLLSTGTLVVGTLPAAYATFTVEGGSITGGAGTTVVTGNIRAYTASATAGTIAVKPNSGVTSMIVNMYTSSSSNTLTTLSAKVKVTITTSASSYNVVDAAESTVYFGSTSGGYTATTDSSSTYYSVANASLVYGMVDLYDTFGNSVTSATGTLSCTVTGGAYCDISTSDQPSSGTGATDYIAKTSASEYYFGIEQGTDNAPATGTVTIKYNDTVLATKSYTIKGTWTKIVVSNVTVGTTATAAAAAAQSGTAGTLAGSFNIAFQDAAGNAVYPTFSANPVSTSAALGLNQAVTAVNIVKYPTSSVTGYGEFTCSGSSTALGISTDGAKASVKLRILDANGNWVYSDPIEMKCGGQHATFTASFDKAVYAPGDIATLTVKFTDTKGNVPSDFIKLNSTNATAGSALVTVAAAPGTVVTAPAVSDVSTAGVKTYQYTIAGNATEGKYNAVVDVSYVRSFNNDTLLGTQGKITIPYEIKSNAPAGVTNAEVLAAIVKLIASINKQIRALQKSLKK